ncbi:LuxR C-terminal-related transcriptional regulator [Polymorphum gilvum]|uniref:Two component transcriptional regulator, LuxR family n=1 Tax=Polymorphum gilvum (strain LMG 25793 / CGMCC 1.9160 / SL003B-26A1) TaxID=991905 RepID=F2IXV1_POLGS|nr:response regulator transcription factor [Polymorphum gilvum]ADZ69432.1 Two component transcriptional regulator, LuxR family [Polymorphum gilvum SL003B-26A1]
MAVERLKPEMRSRGGEIGTVLVIDDHPLFCDALVLTLRMAFALTDVRTANSLSQALGLLSGGLRPDAVVLDLNLPDVSGSEGLVALRRRLPDVPITVVSALMKPRLVSASLAAGACGFVPKDVDREHMCAAFRKMWSGEVYIPDGYTPEEAEGELVLSQQDILSRLATLTPQQTKILKLVCAGKPNKLIAYDLSIAETTVKAHVTAILRKLGAHSRTQAVLVAKEALFFNETP